MLINFEHEGQNVRLNAFPGDHITKVIQSTGAFYEQDLLTGIRDLSLAGTIVDVGANIGNHAVYLGKFTPAERVIAVEPYGPAAKLLRLNILLNDLEGVIIPEECAVGAEPGRRSLLPGPPSNRGHTRTMYGNEVDVVRLDDLLSDEAVSAIKIDVEGDELGVLAGAITILASQRPYLFIEARRRRHKHRLDRFLNPLGYNAVRVFSGASTYAYEPAVTAKV